MPRVKWSRLQKELDYIEPGKIFVIDRREGSMVWEMAFQSYLELGMRLEIKGTCKQFAFYE